MIKLEGKLINVFTQEGGTNKKGESFDERDKIQVMGAIEFPVAEQASATLLLNPEQTVATLFGECEAKTMQELVQLIHELNALPVLS